MPQASASPSTIRDLRERYRAGLADAREQVEAALKRANSNAGRNVYLVRNEAWTRRETELLLTNARRSSEAFESQLLWGIPVSLKDCFDLEGYVTTCGSQYLGRSRAPAAVDSAVASRLRNAGAIITGKTHLHQLTYGITGENLDFGDCLQPADPKLLTGGSSSGAAASVQEGSAMAAIGTDTGGSIRVPASLCGLVGYRASVTMGTANGLDLWRGGEHLAPSFDTIGWLYHNLSDGPLLGTALFGLPEIDAPDLQGLRVGVVDESFLHDCEDEVLAALEHWAILFQQRGAQVARFDAAIWRDAMKLYVPLQASEAAALHPEPRDGFEPAIAERLRWGASLVPAELAELRTRLSSFRQESERQLAAFDVLLLPCCPVEELRAGEDHSGARLRILRYTTPVSLLGWPAVTLPSRRGGPQLVGKLGKDAELLALSAALAGSPGEPSFSY
jgi:Asp-tRNA(Asn)/Glu-tRNA(Gln) amidotransferase A subunit family amidase